MRRCPAGRGVAAAEFRHGPARLGVADIGITVNVRFIYSRIPQRPELVRRSLGEGGSGSSEFAGPPADSLRKRAFPALPTPAAGGVVGRSGYNGAPVAPQGTCQAELVEAWRVPWVRL